MVPVTFLYDWEYPSDRDRRTVMDEFAANGAKHLVFSDTLIKMIERTPRLYRELPQEIAAAGLDLVDAHAPFGADLDPCNLDPAARPYMLAHLKFVLQLVADFGVKSCCVHLCSRRDEERTPEEHRDAACRTLDEVLPLAEKLDVTICLENIPRLCNWVDDVLFCIGKFPSAHLGACFDSGHANIIEKGKLFPDGPYAKYYDDLGIADPWETDVLGRMLPHIVDCHLHDNSGERDQHLLPGKGTVDWSKLVPRLLAAPRLKCIQSEVIPLAVQQPIRPLCEKFRELFGTL